MSGASARATTVLVLGRAVGSLAMLLTPVVLSRAFDPHGFGTYKQLMLVYSTVVLLAPFGLAESLFYFVPRRPDAAGGYVANALVCLALVGGLAGAGVAAADFRLAGFLGNGDLVPLSGLLGLLVALGVAATPLEMVMIAGGRYAAAARTYGASDVLRAVALLAPALLFRRLDLVLLGAVTLAGLRLAATLGWCAREFRGGFRPGAGRLGDQLAYAMPFGAAAALEVLQANVHQYAVAHAFSAAAFAVYAVGCLQVPLVDLVTGSAGNVLMVRLAAEARPEAARELWLDTTRQLTFLLVPLVAWLQVVAPDLIAMLYTATYLDSVPIFRVFCLAILLGVPPTDAVLRARAQTRFLLLLNAVRLALVVVLIGWCLGAFSLVGGAVATLVAAVAAKVVALVRVGRLLEAGLGLVLPWPRLAAAVLASAGAALVALMWRASADGAPWLLVLEASLLFGVSYLALAWLLDGGSRTRARTLSWVRSALAGAGRA